MDKSARILKYIRIRLSLQFNSAITEYMGKELVQYANGIYVHPHSLPHDLEW